MALLIEPPKTDEGYPTKGKGRTFTTLFLGEIIPFTVYESLNGGLEQVISVLVPMDKYWQPAFTSKLKSNPAYKNANVIYPSLKSI